MKQQATVLAEPFVPADDATPLMAQYLTIKAQHQDCLVFFRMGDFYEMFFEDAIKATRALDIALTHRGQYQGRDIPMCGVPFHAYENYLARLIRQGFRVAICEQTEDPAEAKKRGYKAIVNREVVRIVTPGTVTEDSLLDSRLSNNLVCLAQTGDDLAVAWIDLATGAPLCQEVILADLPGLLARLDPSELLVAQRLIENPAMYELFIPWKEQLTPQANSRFDSENARKRLLDIYHVATLDSFGAFSRAEVTGLGALLDYVSLTQKSDLSHLATPKNTGQSQASIDLATQRNLELIRTLQGERQGSLLDAIDRTKTGAGARLLASRLVAPLTDVGVMNGRLDFVSFVVSRQSLRDKLRDHLKNTPDLERALSRLSLGRGGPRDLASVRDALGQAAKIHSLLLSTDPVDRPEDMQSAIVLLGEHNELIDRTTRALSGDLPLLSRDGGFIARGFSSALDELITLRDDSRRLIAGLQQNYADKAGVSGLKIKHNNVIGYYIEVTPLHADKLMAMKEDFIHRQSMANAIRFTTVELGELERKITEAADRALALEVQLFEMLVAEVVQRLAPLRETAKGLAELDVASALAELAVEQNYVRPQMDNSLSFHIEGGRHPVVEQSLRRKSDSTKFVGNDCNLSEDQRLWLLTGPNMAGKSTFLRQNALIVLMAQMGSFVPAKSAHIGVVDRLFSRVGAADDLARGQSTFMVEMVETAAILNQAGKRALVILDEIGRGTATYDGLSIAWATIEYLHDVNGCRTLFATHYHELTALAAQLSSLCCVTMKIKEWNQDIVFMHEVIKGCADRSYGIHVAQMAGLPAPVVGRASDVLRNLEAQASSKSTGGKGVGGKLVADLPLFAASATQVPVAVQTPPATKVNQALEVMLKELNPDEMSPRDALDKLYKIKQLLAE